MNKARRILTSILISSLVFSSTAQATALISTEQAAAVLAPATRSEAHARLHTALDRADLAAMLQARGVSADEMRARIDALTDAEARQLVQQIDEAPAGASEIVGVLFTVFIILLVTDILGLTKVFPFTRSVR
jgi:hypothetical protein